jgi:hypothetical protein
MKQYYIYHIPNFKHKNGKVGKIGCTINPKRRIKKQGYTDYEILEVHIDRNVAAERELLLQKQFGYEIDQSKYTYMDKLINAAAIKKSISVSVYDKNTGDYVATYASFNECARQLNIHNNHISLFFKGKYKSVGGYTFKKK